MKTMGPLLATVAALAASLHPASAAAPKAGSIAGYGPAVLAPIPDYGLLPTVLKSSADGSFYGVASGDLQPPMGAIVRMQPDGSVTILYSADSDNSNLGFGFVDIAEGKDGSLYVASQQGGANGSGTILRLSADGSTQKVLHNFDAPYSGGGGSFPQSLIMGRDSSLYGTTTGGGAGGGGVVFRISPRGDYSVLASFTDTFSSPPMPGGYDPVALVQGVDGALYVSNAGGDVNGAGAIVKVSLDASVSVLHSFDEYQNPSGIVQASDGAFYGPVPPHDYYKLTADGQYTLIPADVLYGGTGKMFRGVDGHIYAFSSSGGTFGEGGLFRLTGGDTLESLSSMVRGVTDVKFPSAAAIGLDGNLYGTGNGATSAVSFELPLPPPAAWGHGPAPTINVSVNPSTISWSSGQRTSTLSWSVTGATVCELSGSPAQQRLPNNGSATVYARGPGITSTYTLNCESPTGVAQSAMASLIVKR